MFPYNGLTLDECISVAPLFIETQGCVLNCITVWFLKNAQFIWNKSHERKTLGNKEFSHLKYSFLLWQFYLITLYILKENGIPWKMRQIVFQIWKEYKIKIFNECKNKTKKKPILHFIISMMGYIKLKPNIFPWVFNCAPFCVKLSQ